MLPKVHGKYRSQAALQTSRIRIVWILGIYIFNKHPDGFYDWWSLENRMGKKSRDVGIWRTWARDLVPSTSVSYSENGPMTAWGWPASQQGINEALACPLSSLPLPPIRTPKGHCLPLSFSLA